jgi:hypothetical protein
LEQGGEFLQLVVVQHPIPLAILGDVLGFQHPAVLSLFKNEVGVIGNGSWQQQGDQAEGENRIGR